MSRSDDIFTLGHTRMLIGLSSIVQVSVMRTQAATTLKWFTGGTLEIGGSNLTWGQGYVVGTGEQFNWDNSGEFYLAATGATVTVMMIRGFTADN